MYRLLIADDEKRLLSGLCEYYPWNELGFTIAAWVENGQKALDYIHSQPVEVVLTDIEMPIMSGTRLAEILHEEYPHIKVVFLSGYADFKYAQQAIRFGVKDYILKPVKITELKCVFSKLQKELDAARTKQQPDEKEKGYYKRMIKSVNHYIETNLAVASLEGGGTARQFKPRLSVRPL